MRVDTKENQMLLDYYERKNGTYQYTEHFTVKEWLLWIAIVVAGVASNYAVPMLVQWSWSW